jgi:hypothetical protein
MPFSQIQKKGMHCLLKNHRVANAAGIILVYPEMLWADADLFLFFEIVFTGATYRAFPVLGYVFPFGSGGNAIVRITCFGVINIATERAHILVHCFLR